MHIPDKAGLYRDVLRVLRPGGRFLASDWLFAEGAETSPAVVGWLAGGPLTFAYVTPEAAGQALAGAGFEAVAIVDRSAVLRAANREEVALLAGRCARGWPRWSAPRWRTSGCTAPAAVRPRSRAAISAPAT